MSATLTLSLNAQRYVVGLRPPQTIGDAASSLKKTLLGAGLTVVPLPPFLPLLEFYKRPPSPVPGKLPPCPSVIVPGGNLQDELNWQIWPFNSEGWFNELRNALEAHMKAVRADMVEEQAFLMPQGKGIPLAETDKNHSNNRANLSIPEKQIFWKALHLECWEISFSPHHPWLMAACWKSVWNRRLKKAGSFTPPASQTSDTRTSPAS